MKLATSLLILACVSAWSQTVKPALQPAQYVLTPSQNGIARVVPLSLIGTYTGQMGPIPIRLKLSRNEHNDLAGSLDGSNVRGIRVDQIAVTGNNLSFRLPSIGALWAGIVGSDRTLTGTWQQGSQNQPLSLVRR